MPRFVRYRPNRLTTATRAERSGISRSYKGTWIDPFFAVHGTLPEKMVYMELSRRGIPFLFLNEVNFRIPEIDFNKDYQADFVIPSLNIIIEVQGAFWHSKPKTVESDAFKFAIYQLKGYKVLAWWDYEILADVQALFAHEPQLASFAPQAVLKSSELPVKSRKKQDTSKGIRTLNRKRANARAYRRDAVRARIR